MEKKVEKKDIPKNCRCGKQGIVVYCRGNKKMVSCPDPLNCPGNYRTIWCSSVQQAIRLWNDDILA